MVSFIENLAAKGVTGKALDVGCGGGRHSIYMSRRGFSCVGIDNSPNALERAKELLDENGFKPNQIEYLLSELSPLPFADNTFDIAVSYGTSFYGTEQEVISGINEIIRTLKKGGHFLITLKSKKDDQFAEAEKTESNVRLSRHNLPMTFFNREETINLFNSKADNLVIDEESYTMLNGKLFTSNFTVTGTKI